jgi:hypothetical protein
MDICSLCYHYPSSPQIKESKKKEVSEYSGLSKQLLLRDFKNPQIAVYLELIRLGFLFSVEIGGLKAK